MRPLNDGLARQYLPPDPLAEMHDEKNRAWQQAVLDLKMGVPVRTVVGGLHVRYRELTMRFDPPV